MKLARYLIPAFALATTSHSICPSRYCRYVADQTPVAKSDDDVMRGMSTQRAEHSVLAANRGGLHWSDAAVIKRSVDVRDQKVKRAESKRKKTSRKDLLKKLDDPELSAEEKFEIRRRLDENERHRIISTEEAMLILNPQELEDFKRLMAAKSNYQALWRRKKQAEAEGRSLTEQELKEFEESRAGPADFYRFSRQVARKLNAIYKESGRTLDEVREHLRAGRERKKHKTRHVSLKEAEQVLDADEMKTFERLIDAWNDYQNKAKSRRKAEKQGRPFTEQELKDWEEAKIGAKEYRKFTRQVVEELDELYEQTGRDQEEIREQRQSGRNMKKPKTRYISLKEAELVLDADGMKTFKRLLDGRNEYQRQWQARKEAMKRGRPLTEQELTDWEKAKVGVREYTRFARQLDKKLDELSEQPEGDSEEVGPQQGKDGGGKPESTKKNLSDNPIRLEGNPATAAWDAVKKFVQKTGSDLESTYQHAASSGQRPGLPRPPSGLGPFPHLAGHSFGPIR